MTQGKQRISGEQRRQAIIKAAVPVFAKKGFHAATSRELANAAGVSEALLYKHFPSKKDMYDAIGAEHFADRNKHAGVERLIAMPPSTRRLVLSVQYLIGHMLHQRDTDFPKLMAQSLLADGEFARQFLRRFSSDFGPFLIESIEASRKAGDISHPIKSEQCVIWLVQHVAFAVRMFSLPEKQVVTYGVSKTNLSDEAARFSLRGLGISSQAMKKHFRPNG